MTFQDKLEKILLNFVYGDDLSTKGTISAIVSATLELVDECDPNMDHRTAGLYWGNVLRTKIKEEGDE